jgi:hypothetical protein
MNELPVWYQFYGRGDRFDERVKSAFFSNSFAKPTLNYIFHSRYDGANVIRFFTRQLTLGV